MKVLFTGMSSSHCKESKNQTFFKTLAEAYNEFSEVIWSEPKLSWSRADLEVFDEIIFGFTPPTSMGANHLYAALKVLNTMYESPKLKLVVDSPQIWQYKNSINSFKRDPDQVFGSFYSSRKNYSEAKNGKIRSHAEGLADKLSSAPWPTTLVPQLPWSSRQDLLVKLPFINEASIVGLNLDSFLLRKETPEIGRTLQWAADDISNPWTSLVSNTTRFPLISVKNSKKPKDLEAEGRIKNSLGILVAPQARNTGTWWSYRYIQGLNTVTPIVTKWQESSILGREWSYLAYQIEDMQPYERQHVAFQQVKSYESQIPNKESAINTLQNLVIEFQPRGI
jgi:hypothetical protein